MTESLTHADPIVAATPEALEDLVSDVTRTGGWSPVCTGSWGDEGATGRVGDRFTGRDDVPGRVRETRSQVVAAERDREFAWLVGWPAGALGLS